MLTATFDAAIRVLVVFGMLLTLLPPRPAAAKPLPQTEPPTAAFSGTPLSGTAPLAVTFSNDSTAAGDYLWEFGDGETSTETAPAHTYAQSGVYTVTLSAGNGVMTDTLVQPTYITVTAATPSAAFSGTPLSGTAPLTVTFSNDSTAASNYLWEFGDGATSAEAAPAHIYAQSGVYTVTLSAGDGVVTDTLVQPAYITVSEAETPQAFFVAQPLTGTTPLTVTFVNSSTNATGYHWRFGDGASSFRFQPSSLTETHTYTQPGVYTVTLSAGDGIVTDTLTRTRYITLTVPIPDPQAAFSATPLNGVRPLTVTFQNDSSHADQYRWDFGDGAASHETDPIHVYEQSGSYTITLQAGNGAVTDTLTHSAWVTVLEPDNPQALFVAQPITGVVPLTITFVNSSTNATQYLWRFGDNQSQFIVDNSSFTITHVYTQAGVYTVSLSAGDGVTTHTLTRTHYLTLTKPVTADFSAFPVNGPAPLTVLFFDASTNATQRQWDFGDGATSVLTNPTHIYAAPGVYTVTLQAGNDVITDTRVRPLFITATSPPPPPDPTAAFAAGPTQGTAPLTVTFVNSSTNATDYHWIFGDGAMTTVISPTHTYAQPGVYTVSLSAGNGSLTDTLTRTNYITVTNPVAPPQAGFTAFPQQGTAPLLVQFLNNSANATAYEWAFGDGLTGTVESPSHTYTQPGVYTVTLTAVSGNLVDTLTRAVTVTEVLTADFSAFPRNDLAPLTVQFFDNSTNAGSYRWVFGDGTANSVEPNPVHTYVQPGVYTVTLSVSNGLITDTLIRPHYITASTPTRWNLPFSDGFENGLDNWIAEGDWGNITGTVRSGNYAVTDSPTGNYLHGADTSLRLKGTLNLSGTISPTLTFWDTYNLAAYDRAYVDVSTDGGDTWTAHQIHYYSSNTGWAKQTVDLSAYAGDEISLRFRLDATNHANTADGWLIDNVLVEETPTPTVFTLPFADPMDSGVNWEAEGEWGLVTDTVRSSSGAFTDSPTGNYQHGAETSLILKGQIDLSGTISPTLTFWDTYTLAAYDRAYVDVSIDGGDTWTAHQIHYYSSNTGWTKQTVDLSAYAGEEITLRFRLDATNHANTADGWYVDDIAVAEAADRVLTLPFSDGFENGLDNWIAEGDWGNITGTVRSGNYAVTDSPTGNYLHGADTSLRLKGTLNLSGTISPTLTFWDTYNLAAYDRAYVDVSTDGGDTWTAHQIHYYSSNTGWAKQTVDLSAYAGEAITLRFRLDATNHANTADGWIIDNVLVEETPTPTVFTLPFADPMDSGVNWETEGSWAVITNTAHSTPTAFTDSPVGNYRHGAETSLLLQGKIDLSGTISPTLTFWDTYNLAAYDRAYVDVSTDGGDTWTAHQIHYYSSNTDWTEQTLDLSAYSGQLINLRFRLDATNHANTADGWYVDDIAVAEAADRVLTLPFSDGFENGLDNWIAEGDWGNITGTVRSGNYAVTDSPTGNYLHGADTSLRLKGTLNLSGTISPTLTFWDTYTLAAYDRAYVDVSTDGGDTWTAHQIHYYSSNSGWGKQTVDLSAYTGDEISLRFRLDATNHANTANGWLIDNVLVEETPTPTIFTLPFSDPMDSAINWEAEGEWGLVTDTVRSSSGAFTDSPTGNYQHGADTSLILKGQIDLSGTISPTLTFWDTYNLAAYDRAYVDVSTDGGDTWTAHQIHYYSSNSGWTLQRLDLSIYSGQLITLRFRLDATNHANVADGWLIDNVVVEETPTPTVFTLPFADPMDSGVNWETEGSWAVITNTAHSTPTAFTDSPVGNYRHGAETSLLLQGKIDLSGTISPTLTFWDTYTLAAYDRAYVDVSTDGGDTWTAHQIHYYSSNTDWTEQTLDLSAYSGQLINLRFRLDATNHANTADGWTVDDIAVADPAATMIITANFNAAPQSGTAPLTVTFTNLSTPTTAITGYLWHFGDSDSSFILPPSSLTPTHIYTQPGVYTVTLTAGNGVVTATLTRTHYITVTAAERHWNLITPTTSVSLPIVGEHALTYNPVAGQVVLYGGNAAGWPYEDATWEFDGSAWLTVTTAVAPEARYGAQLGYVPGQGVLLFGGSDETDAALNRTWVYTNAAWTPLAVSGPLSRTYHSLATAPDGTVYLFGGNDSEAYFNDLWQFENGNWSEITVSGDPPTARTLAALTYDTANERLLLFGGRTVSGTLLADLWAFDLATTTWQLLDDGGGGPSTGSGQAPPARMGHTFTYDPDLGNAVLVGGLAADGDTRLDDVWLYNDSGWMQVSDTSLPSGTWYQAIYTDNAIILVGNGEVWGYE